jgi:hypothetical protein
MIGVGHGEWDNHQKRESSPFVVESDEDGYFVGTTDQQKHNFRLSLINPSILSILSPQAQATHDRFSKGFGRSLGTFRQV